MSQEIRINRNSDYVAINVTSAIDKELSFKAKGIMFYIMVNVKKEKVTLDELFEASSEGEKAVRSGLNELKEKGYIERVPYYLDGKIDHWEFVVSEVANVKPLVDEKKTKQSAESEVFGFYQKNFSVNLTPYIGEELGYLIDDYGHELVIESMKVAINNGIRNPMNYINKVLKSWYKENIKTVDQLHKLKEDKESGGNFRRNDEKNNGAYDIGRGYTSGI